MMFRTSLGGGITNEENVAAHVTALKGKLAGYEAILSKQKYLAGNVSDNDEHTECYKILTVVAGDHSRRSLPSALWFHAWREWYPYPRERRVPTCHEVSTKLCLTC